MGFALSENIERGALWKCPFVRDRIGTRKVSHKQVHTFHLVKAIPRKIHFAV